MQSILGNTRKADITFYRSGRICISAHISKLLSLRSGDVIDILADEPKSPHQHGGGEIYLYVKHRTANLVGRHEGMVFRSNKSGSHSIASSTKLSRYILQQCGCTGDKVRLCCGTPVTIANDETALPIITRFTL